MADSRKIYYIWIYDPRPTEYHPEGRGEFIDYSKGAFTSKEVAEGIRDFMRMFQEVDDPSQISVRELVLHEEATLDEWMAAKGPGARRAG